MEIRFDPTSGAYSASWSFIVVLVLPFGIVILASPRPIASKVRPSAVVTVILPSTNLVNFSLSGQKCFDAPLSGTVLTADLSFGPCGTLVMKAYSLHGEVSSD